MYEQIQGEYLVLQFHNVLGLVALGALRHGELDLVTFVQGLETAALNRGMVYENIIPGIAPDETITFFVVEPLHYALLFHFTSLLMLNPRTTREYNYQTVCFRNIRIPQGPKPAVDSDPQPDASEIPIKRLRIVSEYTCNGNKKQWTFSVPDRMRC
jgi:hypothetical protein